MTRITLEGWLRTAALATAMVAGSALVAEDAHAQDAAKPKKGKKKGGDNDGVGPFKKKDYPTSERMRPLVLPNGMGEVGLDAPIGIFKVAGDSVTTFGIGPSFAYGLGDLVELGVGTGFLLAPDAAWNRTLAPRVAWLAYDSKEFDFAPGLSIPLVFTDPAVVGLTVDLFGRYVLSEGWFIYFGQGAIPIVVGDPLSLSIAGNAGVGWQINKATVATLDLQPIVIVLAPDAAATGLWDYLSTAIGVQYSPVREWDIGGKIGIFNIWDLDESLVFSITPYARFRF